MATGSLQTCMPQIFFYKNSSFPCIFPSFLLVFTIYLDIQFNFSISFIFLLLHSSFLFLLHSSFFFTLRSSLFFTRSLSYSLLHVKATDDCQDGDDLYGWLEDIIKLQYPIMSIKRVTLFKYHWYDLTRRGRGHDTRVH